MRESFFSSRANSEVKQINKNKAFCLLTEGANIWVNASKMLFDNMWQPAIGISSDEVPCRTYEAFNKWINAFEYYNCDNERGRYPVFFMELN